MNYYLDFDYTLFDTYLYRKELIKILEANGINKKYLQLTPETECEGQKLLNVKELFESISKEKGIPLNKLLEPLEALHARYSEFVYKDTVEFLKYLKSKGHKLSILTWGEKKFQSEKLKESKLYNYFDEIIVTEKLKYKLDIDYQNGIFIEDSIRDIKGLYKKNAKQIFRIKRENGKNSKKELNIKEILEFDSLKELQKYLENNY